MGINVFDTSGERFVYLPSIFTSIAIAYISTVFISHPKLWMLTIFCLLVFYSASLHKSNLRWREAASLSKSILDDVVSLSRHTDILILNAPDDLRGVPVYRNGLEQALRTFQRSIKISRVAVVSSHSLPSTVGVVGVVRESKRFSIRLLNEKAEFSRINDQLECVEIGERTRNSLMIELKDCFAGRDVFYFQEGRMVKDSLTQSDSQ